MRGQDKAEDQHWWESVALGCCSKVGLIMKLQRAAPQPVLQGATQAVNTHLLRAEVCHPMSTHAGTSHFVSLLTSWRHWILLQVCCWFSINTNGHCAFSCLLQFHGICVCVCFFPTFDGLNYYFSLSQLILCQFQLFFQWLLFAWIWKHRQRFPTK